MGGRHITTFADVRARADAEHAAYVGLGMPQFFEGSDDQHPEPTPAALHAAATPDSVDDRSLHGGDQADRYTETVTASQPSRGWELIALHVLAITVLGNLGKMSPAFCYRQEAH
ncbi:MAG: hypothetical protein F4Y11_10965 [Chloroflexi bacterium]|nr:hypothetical protein [Chloroflexota bacterium]